jgi:hypothetical protein
MARRLLDLERYKLAVEAYRERPGVFAYAAERAGISHPFAKKLWLKGVSRGGIAFPAIREHIKLEQKQVNQALVEMTKAEETRLLEKWQRTREQAVQNHIKYGETVQEVLDVAAENIQNIRRSGATMSNLADLAASGIGQLTEITPKEALSLLSTYTRTLSEFVDSMKKLQELTASHYGDPQKIVQVNVTHTDTMSAEELLADIEGAAAEAKQLRGTIDAGKLEASVDIIIPDDPNSEH